MRRQMLVEIDNSPFADIDVLFEGAHRPAQQSGFELVQLPDSQLSLYAVSLQIVTFLELILLILIFLYNPNHCDFLYEIR